MTSRIAVAIMTVLLVLYIVIAAQFGFAMIISGAPVAIIMGIAVVALPLLAIWFLGLELLFGVRSQRLRDLLELRGELPEENLPLLPSGRPDRAAAREDLPNWQADVDENPDSWPAWFRLGLAQDAAGDRRAARSSIRHAITLEREQSGAQR